MGMHRTTLHAERLLDLADEVHIQARRLRRREPVPLVRGRLLRTAREMRELSEEVRRAHRAAAKRSA